MYSTVLWGNTPIFNKANLRDLFKSLACPFKSIPIKLESFDQPNNLNPSHRPFFNTIIIRPQPISLSSRGAQPPLLDPALAHYIQGLREDKALERFIPFYKNTKRGCSSGLDSHLLSFFQFPECAVLQGFTVWGQVEMVGLFTPGAHFTNRNTTLASPSPSPGHPRWRCGPIKTEKRRLVVFFDELKEIITCKCIFSFWI